MSIKNIKNRADELLITCKPRMIRICIIMGLVELIPSVFNAGVLGAFISMILLIAFMPYSHGYIVASLKVARNNAQALSDDDAFVGFKRFKELFPTYLLLGVVTFAILFLVMIVLIFIVAALFSGIQLPDMTDAHLLNNPINAGMYMIMSYPSMILAMIFIFLAVLVVMIMVESYMFAVPYLLEEYHMTGMDAIKESFAFIKGNVITCIKLQFSFFGWMLLIAFGQGMITQLLSFLPISEMLGGIIAVFAAAYLYYPKLITSKAILFEEIAYYRYNVTQEESVYE